MIDFGYDTMTKVVNKYAKLHKIFFKNNRCFKNKGVDMVFSPDAIYLTSKFRFIKKDKELGDISANGNISNGTFTITDIWMDFTKDDYMINKIHEKYFNNIPYDKYYYIFLTHCDIYRFCYYSCINSMTFYNENLFYNSRELKNNIVKLMKRKFKKKIEELTDIVIKEYSEELNNNLDSI